MRCEICNGQTGRKKVTKHHWLEGRLYVVESVQAEVCTECGERYFHVTTLNAINAMLRREHCVKGTLEVEVVSLSAV